MNEFGPSIGNIENISTPNGLTDSERTSINTRADLRRRSQEFKVDALNLPMPEETDVYRENYEHTLSLVKVEADGSEKISREDAESYLTLQGDTTKSKAEVMQEAAPNLSAYLLANIAKHQQAANCDFSETLDNIKSLQVKSTAIPKLTPSSMLTDAIVIGVQRRAVEETPLPSMEKIAQEATSDPEFLANYALVLEENQREHFLNLIPEETKRSVSIILDSRVSKVLHASLVEKGTPEEEQRRQVRIRLFKELRETVNNPESTDKDIAKLLSHSLGEMGEDCRQLLLELIRDESESRKDDPSRGIGYLPRVMKVMTDNFDDWRANDIILRTAADESLNKHLSIFLFGKLIEKKYLPTDVAEWWNKRKESARGQNRSVEDENFRLEALQKVAGELGVIPSGQVMEFITDNAKWQENGQTLDLTERITRVRESQAEFQGVESNSELCRLLTSDENKAMTYFLLYGGQDRFNLINNYEFSKFWEMINLIANPSFAENKSLTPLRINEAPIKSFESALAIGGLDQEKIKEIVARLKNGHFPLESSEQAHQEVSFESSENAAILNANAEIGRIMGREQLGVILIFPIYREFLEQDASEQSKVILSQMQSTTTFSDRLALIEQIETQFPDFGQKAKDELQELWVKFGEKMVMELTLDQVFSDREVPIKGEELLPRLDAKRIDLKKINKELLAILRGENKVISDLGGEIARKKKAILGLSQGLERQTDEIKKQELRQKIDVIDQEIIELEARRASMGEIKADDRFAHLSPEDKKAEIDKLSQEVIALTEKSPSAIFTFITMQVLGEERLRENDIALVKELESHLQGPLQSISDFLTYDRGRSSEKKQSRVGLQYLDKTERLMTMVRFADSKICCFSSSNYEMRVQHDTPNKFWVASINADPMSFVVSMEQPQSQAVGEETKGRVKENTGFIFGNFGVDDEGQLALMLNGIYYAPGIEDENQVSAILGGVEKIFAGLPIKKVVTATQYGGSVKMPSEYSNSPVELTRLRALDDGSGRAETHIYDDLGSGADLNKPHNYGSYVWHKDK